MIFPDLVTYWNVSPLCTQREENRSCSYPQSQPSCQHCEGRAGTGQGVVGFGVRSLLKQVDQVPSQRGQEEVEVGISLGWSPTSLPKEGVAYIGHRWWWYEVRTLAMIYIYQPYCIHVCFVLFRGIHVDTFL